MTQVIINTGVDRYEAASTGVDRGRSFGFVENCREGAPLAYSSSRTDAAVLLRRVTGKAIATQQNLYLDAVYYRRKHRLAKGLAFLTDKHRCGAPSKASAMQREQLRT